jgi:arylsulfatase A-like enzyme
VSRPNRPNILWICTDGQRYDTVGALGNPVIRTPMLDRLVANGTAFTRAHAQNTMCTPSRVSFLTGRYCASHHVYRNGNAGLPKGEKLVTKMLADAGYDCGLFGKLHIRSANKGEVREDDGYRVFRWSNMPYPESPGSDRQNDYHQWLRYEKGCDPAELYGSQRAFVGPGAAAELTQSRWAVEMALRFIEQPREGPWLVSLNPFDPHPPYNPPAEFLAHYDPAAMPPPLFRPEDLARQARFRGVRHQNIEARDPLSTELPEAPVAAAGGHAARTFVPPRSLNGRLIKCGYYAVIEMLDRHIGLLLAALEARGELENTLVVFHADHGELLGDHGLIYKGARFFEGGVRVPLILSWPGRVAAGQRATALCELVDVAPTLLEAAGIAVPETMQGRSLLPIASGRADPAHHKTRVVCDFYDSVGFSQVDDPTQATMTSDGRHKMVIYHRHDLGELFDLQNDPGEFVDLWDAPAARGLKSEVMLQHIDAVMATIHPGPRRVTQY